MKRLDGNEIDRLFYYDGDDLGYSKKGTTNFFKFWAPLAEEVSLCVYDNEKTIYNLKKGAKGVWNIGIEGELDGCHYTFISKINGEYFEGVDPYARALTINGEKGAIVKMEDTNPIGWDEDYGVKPLSNVDAIIYEVSVRDISNSKDSGITNKGKFLGLCEDDTSCGDGVSTGLSHIKDLGVTHIQMLPIFDFGSVNEESYNSLEYNWGYDPENYNAPEGSYSTNPKDPYSRIKELKECILTLHKNGIGVIMDVVYNHMKNIEASGFHKLMPGYYFRYDKNGNVSNESGCGNAIASENKMARKFIVDSVKYWAKEYKIDGFRFDLMGLLDVETIKEVRRELTLINPNIIVLGEGWNMDSLLNKEDRAIQTNAYKLNNVGFFNDIIRDGLRGNAFLQNSTGFLKGGGCELQVKKGIVGGINYSGDIVSFGEMEPNQCINYAECHDNHTLFDKLTLTGGDENRTKEEALLGSSIVLLSQGVPFIHCGQEFFRTKYGIENSYNKPDDINSVNWGRKMDNLQGVNYIEGLIKVRKAYSHFRMKNSREIRENLRFIEAERNSIGYFIKGRNEDLFVAHNGNDFDVLLNLGKEISMEIIVNKFKAGPEVLEIAMGSKIRIKSKSTLVGVIK